MVAPAIRILPTAVISSASTFAPTWARDSRSAIPPGLSSWAPTSRMCWPTRTVRRRTSPRARSPLSTTPPSTVAGCAIRAGSPAFPVSWASRRSRSPVIRTPVRRIWPVQARLDASQVPTVARRRSRARPPGLLSAAPDRLRLAPRCAPSSRTSPVTANPRVRNTPPSTVSPPALSATPPGLSSAAAIMRKLALMRALRSNVSPWTVIPRPSSRPPITTRSAASARWPGQLSCAPAISSEPVISATVRLTVPRLISRTHCALPSSVRPDAETASAPPPGGPMTASSRHSCPVTLAWSSRSTPVISQACKLRMPSSRIRVPLNPGSRLLTMRTVRVTDSTNRSSSSNSQCSQTSGQVTVAPIRSSRPVIRPPRMRTAGAWPGSLFPAPSSSALITSARMTRLGSSAAGLPSPNSTQAPRGNASHSACSGSVSSVTVTATSYRGCGAIPGAAVTARRFRWWAE